MRVVTINVNGLKNAAQAGFYEWMKAQDADVVCVQNLKARVTELDDAIYHPQGYEAFFFDAEDVEQGGVAIYSREMPKAIMTGFAYEPADRQGRFLQADFDKVSIATVLAPCALGEDDEKQQEKDEFMDAFLVHLNKTLRKRRQFVFCGSLHTAHLVTDASSKYHTMDVSGFLPHERAMLDELFEEMGYVDAFRAVNLEKKQYTWWPEWAAGWRKQAGWRTDYQIASPSLRSSVKDAWIDTETRFSDHAPLIVDYDFSTPEPRRRYRY